jgi:hypothetical protein
VSDSGDVYGWDAVAQRYRDLTSGQFISADDVHAVMQERIDTAFARFQDMTAGLADGSVDIGEFQEAVMVELRRAYTEMTALSYGGWDQVSQAGWGAIGAELKSEYQYLAGFMDEIAAGNLSEAQIAARLDQYANGIWGAYENSKTDAMGEAGYDEEIRDLEAGAEHCEDCLAAAGHWEGIGELPDIGDSQCGSNCQCTKRFRNSATGEESD